MQIDKSSFQEINAIRGDGVEDAQLLGQMAVDARRYLESFEWCPKIDAVYLARGVGGIAAIFYFELRERVGGTDDALWVVTGDIPDAYLVVEPNDSPREALSRYCDMMESWAVAVLDDKSLTDVFPVAAKPSPENARSLRGRIAFIRSEIVLSNEWIVGDT